MNILNIFYISFSFFFFPFKEQHFDMEQFPIKGNFEKSKFQ